MSNRAEREAEDLYEAENDPEADVDDELLDSSYATHGAGNIPVQSDSQDYDDPVQPPHSNSNQQLEQDEREAINKSNILRGSRLRHAKPQTGNAYNEGPDEDDLPSEVQYTGQSATR